MLNSEKYQDLDYDQITPEMGTLFDQAKNLQKRIYGSEWPQNLNQFILYYGMRLHMEVDEMIREVDYEPMTRKKKHVDIEALKKEIIDVFIFTTDVANTVFESYDQFIREVKEKMDYNERRQDWDINKKTENR